MKNMMIASFVATMAMAGTLHAAEDVKIRVLGFWGNQPQVDDVDRKVWEGLAEQTDGRIQTQYLTLNEAGIKGDQALRFLKRGTFDIMTISVSYVSGDEPSLVAVDLPAIAYDFDTLRQISDSYRGVMAERVKPYNGVFLTHWPFNPQILFCKEQAESLDALGGEKVRVSGAPAADTLEELDATAVDLTGGEVYQALQRGLVDCGTTGSTFGYRNKWHEVTSSLYDLPLGGYSQVIQVANKDFWESLSDEDQKLISSKLSEAEEALWEMAPVVHEQGIRCATGEGECELGGEAGGMTYADVSEEDRKELDGILKSVIIPRWKESCNASFPECGETFDETIGQVIGIAD